MQTGPLQKALGYRPGQRVAWVSHPPDYPELLGPLPAGIEHVEERVDCAHVFCRAPDEARERMQDWAARLAPGGMLWVSWPEPAGDPPHALDADLVRDVGRGLGLMDAKQCTLPGWGALKLVPRRRQVRAASSSGGPGP